MHLLEIENFRKAKAFTKGFREREQGPMQGVGEDCVTRTPL